MTYAESAAARVYHSEAPIRQAFIRSHDGQPSPLARLLRGGQGGAVRLKLYLSLLFIARKAPYDTDFPARKWAQLLKLEEPYTLGARRIADAVDWLERQGFVRVERISGSPSKIYLMDDGGRRIAYNHPAKKRPGQKGTELYIQLPATFWTNDWLVTLSARALALWLVLRDQHQFPGQRPPNHPIWLSPGLSRSTYSLSPDTWTAAARELIDDGLVTRKRRAVDEDTFGWSRVRNTYRLNLERLEEHPTDQAIPFEVVPATPTVVDLTSELRRPKRQRRRIHG